MNSFHFLSRLTADSHRLALPSAIAPESLKARCTKLWHQFWTYIVHELATSSEPHVWLETDSKGQTCWHGYDPIRDRHTWGTEAELRVWLEERYSA